MRRAIERTGHGCGRDPESEIVTAELTLLDFKIESWMSC